MQTALYENVDAAARLCTDEWAGYKPAKRYFLERGHHSVRHSRGEYALPGGIHSNTIESAFSMLKRGIDGTFHHVSRKHLHRYCDEFAFRWTWRGLSDLSRAEIAIRKSQGKRVTRAQIAASTGPKAA